MLETQCQMLMNCMCHTLLKLKTELKKKGREHLVNMQWLLINVLIFLKAIFFYFLSQKKKERKKKRRKTFFHFILYYSNIFYFISFHFIFIFALIYGIYVNNVFEFMPFTLCLVCKRAYLWFWDTISFYKQLYHYLQFLAFKYCFKQPNKLFSEAMIFAGFYIFRLKVDKGKYH